MEPNSTLDLVGWAMPGDRKKATGWPSMVARMVAPTVSSMKVCQVEAEGEGDDFAACGCGWFAGGAFGAGASEAYLVHEGDLIRCDAR
jgi:hypothetical protein